MKVRFTKSINKARQRLFACAVISAAVIGLAIGAGQAGALNLAGIKLSSPTALTGAGSLSDATNSLTGPLSVPTGVTLVDPQNLLATTGAGELLGEQALSGEVKALLPMPLDPKKSCADCHNDRAALVAAMTNVEYNLKYPGLAADVPFVDNYYVDPSYTEIPDSMMSKAKMHPAWDGCKTCHGSGETFDPFPSDNWVPDSNPMKGPQNAWGANSTNNTSNSCGKCHTNQADAFNKGIMGTHKGHLGAFNYNDVETDGVNVSSDFRFSPLGSRQGGTPGGSNTGYLQSRNSCSACHQGCSDCHLTGPDDSPIGEAGMVDVLKGSGGVELINVDQSHTTVAPRVKAYMTTALRRGGVFILELRKGYIPGVSRGIPYTQLEAGMDITTHKLVKPTTLEQGNTMAPQSQQQSIDFCWRCHFRSGAEYVGNWINVVPNPNYSKSTLGHLNAGMTCTDCHNANELHGDTSAESASFFGTTDAPDNPSHPGGNPRGSTAAWPITPNPVKVTCELCHTKPGKATGPTGGQLWGNLVTPRFQAQAKQVKGLDTMNVAGREAAMSHANVQCDVCHTQAQQNCWNCHIETAEEANLAGGPIPGTSSSDATNLEVGLPIINVREAEGEPVLTDAENALLKEAPARNDVANIVALITFPQSVNTVNKAPRFMGRNNQGQVASMVHCPGPAPGINNEPYNNPQPLNLDGGLYITKSGNYGEDGSVPDVTMSGGGSWYMEAGHSIARNPDGDSYTACFNCHADTVRLGLEPITYYRKNPWVMKSAGVPEAIMPDSHFLDNRYRYNGNLNCRCHSEDGVVHNGTEDGPFPEHAGSDQYGH